MNNSNISTEVKSEFERIDRTLMLEFGEYWRYTPVHSHDSYSKPTNGLQEDEIYSINDLLENVITGKIQTVQIYVNKLHGSGGNVRFDFESFATHFTPVPQDDVKAIRAAQLNAIEAENGKIQAEIKLALTNPEALLRMIQDSEDHELETQRGGLHRVGLPSPESLASRNTALIPEAGSMVAVDIQRKRYENQAMLGTMANRLATVKANQLTANFEKVSSLMMESAYAMQGKSNSMLRKVKGVLSKVEIMKLYLGEDVEVKTIVDGDVSTSKAPVSLCSAMVYMDEEIAVNRIFSERDSFDYSNSKDFIQYLKDTPSLINRLFPTERAIITIRPTRHTLSYQGESDSSWRTKNEYNHQAYILVRDGARLSAIFSPIKYNKRLFPISSEMDSFFANVFTNSINLVDKQREFEDLSKTYQAVVAVLQGVKDRQEEGGIEVFGDFQYEANGKSLLEEVYIKRNCTFVDEEDNLLGDDQQSPVLRISALLNAPLFSKGDIAIYSPNSIMNLKVVPSAYEDDVDSKFTRWSTIKAERDTTGKMVDKLAFARISIFAGEPMFMLEAETGYGEYLKTRNFRAFPSRSHCTLNLMSLEPSFIESALNSRRYRAKLFEFNYMDYLVEARQIIKDIQVKTAGLMKELSEYYPNFSADKLHLMIMGWYRGYNGTSKINVKAAVTQIVNDFQKSSAFNSSTVEIATDLIKALGDEPMYVSKVDGRMYVIAWSNRLINRYPIKYRDQKYPFFALHEIAPSGEILDTSLVGSEVQTYPVDQVLHLQANHSFSQEETLELSLERFCITKQRYSGEDIMMMNKSSTANRKYITETLQRIEQCIDSQFSNDDLIIEVIFDMISKLKDMNAKIKDVKDKVTYGVPLAVYRIFTNSEGKQAHDAIGICLPRAIKYLYYKLSAIYRETYYGEIAELLSDLLYWDDILKNPKKENLVVGDDGVNEFLGSYSSTHNKMESSHFIYTETKALQKMYVLQSCIESARNYDKDKARTLEPFVELLKTEAKAPNLFKSAVAA